jgi:hypothetical protein
MPKPMKAPSGGRADRIIADLERLHREAHKIFDAYVDELRLQSPGIPFGVIKGGEITGRAGLSLNYVAALKMLRDRSHTT